LGGNKIKQDKNKKLQFVVQFVPDRRGFHINSSNQEIGLVVVLNNDAFGVCTPLDNNYTQFVRN
jgi:hypothetical protein